MSKLDDQLKELQSKKLKTEFFKLIKDNIDKIKSDQFTEVADGVKEEVTAFIDAQIDMIESGEIHNPKQLDGLFSSDEVTALKAIAARAIPKIKSEGIGQDANPEVKQEPIQKKQTAAKQDQLSFALQWRHLGQGKVQVNGKGEGKCVGMVAPNIIVKLDTGVEISVLPEEILKV